MKDGTVPRAKSVRRYRSELGPVDLPKWAGPIAAVWEAERVPSQPSPEVIGRYLVDLIEPTLEKLLDDWTRDDPRFRLNVVGTRRLNGLVRSVIKREVRAHPEHTVGEACALIRGRRTQPNAADVLMLRTYLTGRAWSAILEELGLAIGTRQGFLDAVARPIFLAMRDAYWKHAESQLVGRGPL